MAAARCEVSELRFREVSMLRPASFLQLSPACTYSIYHNSNLNHSTTGTRIAGIFVVQSPMGC